MNEPNDVPSESSSGSLAKPSRELPTELPLSASLIPDVAPDPSLPPRDAATVMLLRDNADELEVFLLRRVGQMEFAAGMTVFPGGGVDRRDLDATIPMTGPDARWWAQRFGCSESLAGALVCAAVREMFEESGVLLAGKSADTVVADTSDYRAARQQLVDRELSFAEFLTGQNLVLRADLLRPWADWITPIGEIRRYDAKFFVAQIPPGQRADGETTEADDSAWRTPSAALTDAAAGRTSLMAPTHVTLVELSAYSRVADVLAAHRDIVSITPQIAQDGDGYKIVMPGSPLFREETT